MTHTTYIQDILNGLQQKVMSGETIDLQGLADCLDHSENLVPVSNWIIQFTEHTKRDWKTALHRAKVKQALGGIPGHGQRTAAPRGEQPAHERGLQPQHREG